MIVSFSASNFRSFAEEQTLSLVASNRLTGNSGHHIVPIPDSAENVLRVAVLYGANGAGKSNLFKAVRYVRTLAINPQKRGAGTARQAFCFGDDPAAPSTFDLQFVAGNRLYRFGIKVDDSQIQEEWLLHVDGGRERVLYERVTTGDGDVTIEAPAFKAQDEKLAALASIGGPANQSFLATIRALLKPEQIGEELSAILHWFEYELILVAPDESLASMGNIFSTDRKLLEFAGSFLNDSSTGIDHLTATESELTEDELRNLLPEELLVDLMNDLRSSGTAVAVVPLTEGNEIVIERKGSDRYFRIRLEAAHRNQRGEYVNLPLTEESDGTRRLLHLIPALHHSLNSRATYFIDEIDRSLHPILVRKYLDSFLNSCDRGASQVILTTHESHLLDQDLLRRDEIWFAEKDDRAATHLYSLMDFKVRNDLEIRKHYLHGRFGAIPFFGETTRLPGTEGLAK